MSSNPVNPTGGHPPPGSGVVGPQGVVPHTTSNPIQMPEQSQPVDLATSKQPLRIPTVPRPNLAPPRSTGGVAILGKTFLTVQQRSGGVSVSRLMVVHLK